MLQDTDREFVLSCRTINTGKGHCQDEQEADEQGVKNERVNRAEDYKADGRPTASDKTTVTSRFTRSKVPLEAYI